MDRHELDGLSREGLIAFAEKVGVARPRVLTQPELVDEILAKSQKSDREKTKARGWVGRARDLVARLIEKGLHMPDKARPLGSTPVRNLPEPPPPLATVTLAEIYAAQGHLDRALLVLDEVLAKEPEHRDAQRLRDRFADQAARARAKTAKAGAAGVETAPTLNGAGTSKTTDPVPAPNEASPAPQVANPDASADADAPLPIRYEIDEVVAIAVDPRTIYLYWEIRPTTLAHARKRTPEGRLAIRVLSVLASWDGPITRKREINVDALHGDLYVHDIEPGSHVRVAIGWLSSSFEPFAVGMEVAAPQALPIETAGVPAVARWRAEGDSGGDVTGLPPVSPAWQPVLHSPLAVGDARASSMASTPVYVPRGGPTPLLTEEHIVEHHRIRRPIRGGASDLAWETVEFTRRESISRGSADEVLQGGPGDIMRGGSSEIFRGGSSEFSRR